MHNKCLYNCNSVDKLSDIRYDGFSIRVGGYIMDERRRRKRTDLDAHLTIKRLDGSDIGEVEIDVTDVSITGIGFVCTDELQINAIYEGTLTIWTKERIRVFLNIVRKHEKEDGINYGAHFVGMPDLYKRKIGVYQTVEEESKKKSEIVEE